MINRTAAVSRTEKLLSIVQSILLIVLIIGCAGCGANPNIAPTPTPTQTPSAVTITVAFSTEMSDWLTAAKNAFNKQYQGRITVELLDARGSVAAIDAIAGVDQNGTPIPTSVSLLRPTIWSPADKSELYWLSRRWDKAHLSPAIIDYTNFPPEYIVHSYLVFAGWQSRSAVMSHSFYKNLTWDDIHALLLLHDWSQVGAGGKSEWGNVKFGQTQPDLSNSGLMTLALIAYSYFNTNRGLTPDMILNNSGFRAFLKDIEDNVQCFGPSSGPFTDTFIRDGSPNLNIITTYENLVLTRARLAQKSEYGPLVMYYPPGLKMKSEHPFAILQGGWVRDEQKRAAQTFLNFLKESEQQKSALTFGLRPENLPITADVKGNLFINPPGITIQSDQVLTPAPQVTSGETLEALVQLWRSLPGISSRQC